MSQQIKGYRRFRESQVGRETVCGNGSRMDQTQEIRAWLPLVLRRLGVATLADVPCGDHHWLSTVDLTCQYVGYDALVEQVEENRRRYPFRRFEVFDAVVEVVEPADCILCRDLLVHLPLASGLKALDNFRASGAKWLLANTFPDECNVELQHAWPGWGWRPLNLEAEPFSLGSPIDGVREIAAGYQFNRWMRAYDIRRA